MMTSHRILARLAGGAALLCAAASAVHAQPGRRRPAAPPPAPRAATSDAAQAQALITRITDDLWEYGDRYWHAGRFEDRILLDYTIIELEPGFLEAYGTASWLIDSNGRPAEAEALLKRATRVRPDAWNAWDELGDFYFRGKRYREAVDAFRRATEKPGCHPKVFHSLGHACRLSGDLKASLHAWEEAKRREPNDPVVDNNLKKVRGLIGKP